MLLDFIQSVRQGNIYGLISTLVTAVIILLVCFPVHESAHGLMAYWLGDPTAKFQKRISMNPARHLDLIGSVLILICGFGFAKPVPVNMYNFKKPKRDMALVALAGPVSNLLMAVLFVFFMRVFVWISLSIQMPLIVGQTIMMIFQYGAIINISLAVFNLIPLPPLDGSRILGLIVGDKTYYKIMQYESILLYVTLALIALGSFSNIIGTATNTIYGFLLMIFGLA